MKELEEFKEKPIEIVAEQQQKKEIKHIGQQRKVRGHILWEFNERTRILKRAEFKKTTVYITGTGMSPESVTETHKVVVNESCIYFQAMNEKNARKKLIKSGYSIKEIE